MTGNFEFFVRVIVAGIVIVQLTAQLIDDGDNKERIEARRHFDLVTNDELEDELDEAKEFGIKAMNELYDVEEPKLFSNGVYLTDEHPARYLAAFNRQTEEAKNLAMVAYAALKGSRKLAEKYANATDPVASQLVREATTSWNSRSNGFRERCPRRDVPNCPPASKKYRTADGSCNNLEHLWWGSAMSTMQRFLDPVYSDGIESIRRSRRTGRPLPSPRDISVLIHGDRNIPLASVTHMLMQWGQFVDHDLTAAAQSRGFNGTFPQCCRNRGAEFQPPELMHPDCLPIIVNPQDKFFGKQGVRCLEFVRSGPAPREECGFGPREQLSQVTSYLDASMVYSNNAVHSDSLRIFRNGLLQYGKIQSRKPLLPRGEPDDLCRRGSLSTNCFRAGDARLSEQPGLTSLHVVFLRLHNRIATELAALNSQWSDEKLYQESRKIVGALIQQVTYREYLPIVLGPEVMRIFDLELEKSGYYRGYDSNVNPNIANSFAAAAYRFGHSLVQPSLARYDRNHHLIFDNITIHEEFTNRINLQSPGSVDRILLGLINQPSQRRDEFITEELTNNLFKIPGFSFGMDLAAINIQRGRDHGLAPYVDWREPCGLSSVKTWQDLERVTSPSVTRNLRRIYDTIEDIDLFTAGLAEKPVVGGLVGPTFACIIAQQFGNLRKGDRFWYENPHRESSFSLDQLDQLRHITLAKIMCKTLDTIDTIQPFVFLTADTLRNDRISCSDERFGQLNFEAWRERSTKNEIPKQFPEFTNKINDENRSPSRHRLGPSDAAKALPWSKPKPIKTNVNQKNRIVVKRPFGSQDNVTIVVSNHAVNSPVFVNDAIYNSHVELDNLQLTPSQRPLASLKPPARPSLPQINYPGINPNPSLTPVNDQVNYEFPHVGTGGAINGPAPSYSGQHSGLQGQGSTSFSESSPNPESSGYHTGSDSSVSDDVPAHFGENKPADYQHVPTHFIDNKPTNYLHNQPLVPSYPAGTRPYVPPVSDCNRPHSYDPDDPNPSATSASAAATSGRPFPYEIPQYHHHQQTPSDWLNPIQAEPSESPAQATDQAPLASGSYGMRASSEFAHVKHGVDVLYDIPKPLFISAKFNNERMELTVNNKHYQSASDFSEIMRDTYSSTNEFPRPLLRKS